MACLCVVLAAAILSWTMTERLLRPLQEVTATAQRLSAESLGEYPVSVVHSVREHARLTPDQPMIAERVGGEWRRITYAEAVAAADAIGQGLLDRGLGPEKPLLILSGNGVDHLLVTLGAMTAGVPVAPVSVAYSLQSRDHARIRAIAELIGPGAVFAEDAGPFGPALDALPGVPVIASRGGRPGAGLLSGLLGTEPGAAVALNCENVTRVSPGYCHITSMVSGTSRLSWMACLPPRAATASGAFWPRAQWIMSR